MLDFKETPPCGGAAASRVEADEVYGLRGHDEAALGGRELGASEDRDREVTDLAYKLGWRVVRAHEYRTDRGVATTEARLAAAAQDALELVGERDFRARRLLYQTRIAEVELDLMRLLAECSGCDGCGGGLDGFVVHGCALWSCAAHRFVCIST